MRLLYDTGIRGYYLGAWILSLWNRKARLWVRGRRGWFRKLTGAIGPDDPVIWFHCASLGEFEQGRPVIDSCRKRFPARVILLTFFSPSGYEKRKEYPAADYVMYLPLDTRKNARRMLGYLRLEQAMFIKYEFWYHFLDRLDKSRVPVYLLSGIFRREQLFFKWYGGWYRKFLKKFTHLFVQHARSGQLLEAYGISSVTVAGDTRFDRVCEVTETPFRHQALESFCSGKKVVVAGSTWDKDEQLLAYTREHLPDREQIRWIIAPHEISETHLTRLSRQFPDSARFSRLGERSAAKSRVVIVDTIGQLASLYRFGNVGYVGGGFGKGIHNILEPAAYGLPVVFGTVYGKFAEAHDLIRLGGAFPVENGAGLHRVISELLANGKKLAQASRIACSYVSEKRGATESIMEHVFGADMEVADAGSDRSQNIPGSFS